jgi:hypothetical protein
MTDAGIGFTLLISPETHEYIKISTSYNELNPNEPAEPQLLKQREIAVKALNDQIKLQLEKSSTLSLKAETPELYDILSEIAKKIEELENGLASITQRIPEKKVRKGTKGLEAGGDGLGGSGGDRGAVSQ